VGVLALPGCGVEATTDTNGTSEQPNLVPPPDPCQPSHSETTTYDFSQLFVGSDCNCTFYKLCTMTNTYGHDYLCDPPAELSYLKSSVTQCGDTVYSTCSSNFVPPPCP